MYEIKELYFFLQNPNPASTSTALLPLDGGADFPFGASSPNPESVDAAFLICGYGEFLDAD